MEVRLPLLGKVTAEARTHLAVRGSVQVEAAVPEQSARMEPPRRVVMEDRGRRPTLLVRPLFEQAVAAAAFMTARLRALVDQAAVVMERRTPTLPDPVLTGLVAVVVVVALQHPYSLLAAMGATAS